MFSIYISMWDFSSQLVSSTDFVQASLRVKKVFIRKRHQHTRLCDVKRRCVHHFDLSMTGLLQNQNLFSCNHVAICKSLLPVSDVLSKRKHAQTHATRWLYIQWLCSPQSHLTYCGCRPLWDHGICQNVTFSPHHHQRLSYLHHQHEIHAFNSIKLLLSSLSPKFPTIAKVHGVGSRTHVKNDWALQPREQEMDALETQKSRGFWVDVFLLIFCSKGYVRSVPQC